MNPWITATAIVIALVVYILYRARGFDRPLAAFQPPEPSRAAPWRSDPALRPLFLEGLPDDIPADFQDPEGARVVERMWVRLDRKIGEGEYEGILLNAPNALCSVREGDRVRVRVVPGAVAPIGTAAR